MNPYGNWGQPHSEGKSALSLALAYDWLAGTGYFDSIPDTDATIRDLLYAEAVKMFLHPVVPFMLNNWKIRFNAGMGMTALAIRDYAQGIFSPDFLFASAEFRVTSTLEYQAAPPDGNVRAYAERSQLPPIQPGLLYTLLCSRDKPYGHGPLSRRRSDRNP